MAVFVALLRGVNLGGKNKVPMAELRAACESLGFTDVATLLQSGNVVFRSKRPVTAARIEDAVEDRFGFRVLVVLRTASDLHEVIARDPFPDAEPSKLLVSFLASDPGDEARQKALAAAAGAPEEVRAFGRELYIYYPNGMARPKLSVPALERALRVGGTGRNWNTVRKLCEMAEALEAAGA